MTYRSLSKPLLALAMATTLLPHPAFAQGDTFPSKAVRIIVPATPGGTSDIFARAISGSMAQSLGKPVLTEYKAGAATNIGTEYVVRSPADGYTLLINGLTIATNPSLFTNMNFNPVKDLVPIIEVAEIPNVVTVHPSLSAKTMKELMALIKANPGMYNFGTPGAGSSGHMSGELLSYKTNTKLVHIAYQGNAQAVTDHITGLLQVGFVNLPVAMPFVKDGKLRALAVTSAKRSPLMPDVPTVAEALDMPDFELSGWFGMWAPAGTPPDVVARLQREVQTALADPAVRSAIAATGADVVGGTSAAFAEHIKRDTARLSEVIRVSGISIK